MALTIYDMYVGSNYWVLSVPTGWYLALIRRMIFVSEKEKNRRNSISMNSFDVPAHSVIKALLTSPG